jgi:hypothetical protein
MKTMKAMKAEKKVTKPSGRFLQSQKHMTEAKKACNLDSDCI